MEVTRLIAVRHGETAWNAEGRLHHQLGCSTFAEHAVVSRRSVVPIDKAVPFEDAALFGCAVLTGEQVAGLGERGRRRELVGGQARLHQLGIFHLTRRDQRRRCRHRVPQHSQTIKDRRAGFKKCPEGCRVVILHPAGDLDEGEAARRDAGRQMRKERIRRRRHGLPASQAEGNGRDEASGQKIPKPAPVNAPTLSR